jgi:lipopolysaccharide heptosyltransferase III
LRRLLIRPGAIGDCILSLPALECLRADYTEAWVPSPVVPLIRFADRARSIASTGLDLLGLEGVEPPPKLIESLRGFDSIYSWYGSNRAEFRECVRALELPVTFLDALPPPESPLHAADHFLREAGCSGPPAVPRIPVPAQQRGDFAVIHPFSGSVRKNWPLDRFRELARGMPLPVQWCAGPSEALEDAVRFDDLYELACWLATARLYIGNDSGITHLAAAIGTPVVALFGPADPAIWAPRGPRVQIVKGNLATISVEQVLSEARRMATFP